MGDLDMNLIFIVNTVGAILGKLLEHEAMWGPLEGRREKSSDRTIEFLKWIRVLKESQQKI